MIPRAAFTMNLATAIIKIWRPFTRRYYNITDAESEDALSTWRAEVARTEYKRFELGHLDEQRTIVQQIAQTHQLIKHHLIEALSSPSPYVREWAKLIMEERNEQSWL